MTEPIKAIRAIEEWTKKTCTDENLKMGDYVTEEIYGRVTRFIDYMLEEPNTIADIRKKIPNGLSRTSETTNALTQSEFNTLVSYTKSGVTVDDSVLLMLHATMECYIYKLIHEGAQLVKKRGSNELTVGDVNTIRLKYFPVKIENDEPELGEFFDLVVDKKIKSKKIKSKRCPKGKRKNKRTHRCKKIKTQSSSTR